MAATSSPTRRRRAPKLSIERGDHNNHLEKKRKRKNGDDSFAFLVVQVGATIACLMFVTCVLLKGAYSAYRLYNPVSSVVSTYDDDDSGGYTAAASAPDNSIPIIRHEATLPAATPPPLPQFNLSEASNFDAYALYEQYATNDPFWTAAKRLLTEFSSRYGGENAARAMFERGFTVISKHPHSLPCRIQRELRANSSFFFSFAGYSVTNGRGNYFQQSYPLVMEQHLHDVFQLLHAAAPMKLRVRNAAIGGCPSFPYGFCLPNFLGKRPNVVSWDFSMNEAGDDPTGLEAYIRHVQTAFATDHVPLLIVRDTHTAVNRKDVLRHYKDVLDTVVMHTDPAAEPYLKLPEEYRPIGFQEWRKFGAPPGAPGQQVHHPAVKEHEFIAWMLTIYVLGALELVAAAQVNDAVLHCENQMGHAHRQLLRPMAAEATNATLVKPWSSILFGYKERATKEETWRMNPVFCRTSYEPVLSGHLSELVVSGLIGADIDIMLPKSNMFYNQGWVADMSENEKKAKHKLDRYGGLGFVDSKKAYYGLYASGALQLFIPLEKGGESLLVPKAGDMASHFFQSIVVCEVNEKRIAGACETAVDARYRIGGVNASAVQMDAAGSIFMGEKLCMYLSIPKAAKITTRALRTRQKGQQSLLDKTVDNLQLDDQFGVLLEINVVNLHLMRPNQACSVSHVVWEQTTLATKAL